MKLSLVTVLALAGAAAAAPAALADPDPAPAPAAIVVDGASSHMLVARKKHKACFLWWCWWQNDTPNPRPGPPVPQD